MKEASSQLLIGAHTSAAGGLHNALLEGQRIGATTIQLFTSNQRQWASKPLTPEIITQWNQTLQETGLRKIMSHSSYLINLGSPNEEVLKKSIEAFKAEIERCKALKISFLNFHPGASLNDDTQKCLDRIVESLLEMEPYLEKSPIRLLLESTAGQGTSVGYKFEQLNYIIERVKDVIPIGVCVDTCHSFVAGYDLRTRAAVDSTLTAFDSIIGLNHLQAFHLNDSVKGLGSRVDRHKSLGEGAIGMECFQVLMSNSKTREVPKYIETPDPSLWKKEIATLRKFAEYKELKK